MRKKSCWYLISALVMTSGALAYGHPIPRPVGGGWYDCPAPYVISADGKRCDPPHGMTFEQSALPSAGDGSQQWTGGSADRAPAVSYDDGLGWAGRFGPTPGGGWSAAWPAASPGAGINIIQIPPLNLR